MKLSLINSVVAVSLAFSSVAFGQTDSADKTPGNDEAQKYGIQEKSENCKKYLIDVGIPVLSSRGDNVCKLMGIN